MSGYKNYSKDSLRNLSQYKNLTDKEFDAAFKEYLIEKKEREKDNRTEFKKRIDQKIAELSEDYDIEDLKYNDLMQLNDLASAILTLEDFQETYHMLQQESVTNQNISVVERLARVISIIRSDISKLQDDLKLSRKIRKSDKEESVSAYITNLIREAKGKYEKSLTYIFCPKCNTLVCNAWFLYPDASNKLTLTCRSILESGEICDHRFSVTSKGLMKDKGMNNSKLFPG